MLNDPTTMGRTGERQTLSVSLPSVAGLNPATEQHFTPQEIAEAWQLDVSTVRRLFQDEPGVLKIGNSCGRRKRTYMTLRVPESVLWRVHQERSR